MRAKKKHSLIIVPLLICFVFLVLGIFIPKFDKSLLPFVRNAPFFSADVGKESARSFLSTLGISMLIMGGIFFSMTTFILSQHSHLLRKFFQNWVTPGFLGIFSGIFIFCLVALVNLQSNQNIFTVSFGLIFALVGILFLFLFIREAQILLFSKDSQKQSLDENSEER